MLYSIYIKKFIQLTYLYTEWWVVLNKLLNVLGKFKLIKLLFIIFIGSSQSRVV